MASSDVGSVPESIEQKSLFVPRRRGKRSDMWQHFRLKRNVQRNKKESEIVVLGHFESIANFIFKDMEPFSVVEGNGFREMFRSIDDSRERTSLRYSKVLI